MDPTISTERDHEGRDGENDSRNDSRTGWWNGRTRRERAALVLFVTTMLLAVLAIPVGRWWSTCGGQCPTIAELRTWQPSEGGQVLDREGNLLAPLTPTRRVNVPLERIPAHVRQAFIAVEDRRFHEHGGLDWRGVARAFVNNLRSGGVREGASTITMQLARNVFLSDRATERTLSRKLLEWRYAELLEDALTKEEILERYLNAIYLGNGVYGVEGAAQDLFGKSIEQVTYGEAALLAGLPKAPSVYSPRRDVERATERRNVALQVMLREKVVDRANYETARRNPVPEPRAEWRPDRPVASWASEYAREIVDSLKKAGDIDSEVQEGQLIVHTTIDTRAQRGAEEAVERGASQIDRQRYAGRGARVEGALVAIDPNDGAIRALVGGRSKDVSGFHRAIRAKRQPGSAFKPFVYAAALQQGFTAATALQDEPIEIPDNGRVWRPANFDHRYFGRISMRDALTRSANAATIRLSRDVGMHNVISVARATGIESELPAVPSLALGVAGVTPLELTTAYASFANGGMRVSPHIVLRIDDVFGRTLWVAPPPVRSMAMAPADAFIVTSMLRSVVDRGTANGIRSAGVRGPVAGKTGTTNDGADVWFVGYTPSIVAAVWFGSDLPRPLGATGGRVAAPAWATFINKGWHSPAEDSEWLPPAGVVERSVDVATGLRADPWCGASRQEWFKLGSEPVASCTESLVYASYESGWGDIHTDSLGGTLDTLSRSSTSALGDSIRSTMRRASENASEAVRAMMRAAGFRTSNAPPPSDPPRPIDRQPDGDEE